MASFASDETLLAVSKAGKADLSAWGRGIHLEASTGRTLEELRHRVVADRIVLAASLRVDGVACATESTGAYRSAVSRFYYCIYQAGRAVVYFQKGGDDHQEHSSLPGQLPGDFPDRNRWLNAMTGARLDRNRADYDPYPKSPRAWRGTALSWQAVATDFLATCRAYLRLKGCSYV